MENRPEQYVDLPTDRPFKIDETTKDDVDIDIDIKDLPYEWPTGPPSPPPPVIPPSPRILQGPEEDDARKIIPFPGCG